MRFILKVNLGIECPRPRPNLQDSLRRIDGRIWPKLHLGRQLRFSQSGHGLRCRKCKIERLSFPALCGVFGFALISQLGFNRLGFEGKVPVKQDSMITRLATLDFKRKKFALHFGYLIKLVTIQVL